MKKLLSLLATVSLVSTSTASVVACGETENSVEDDSNIDALRALLLERLQEAVNNHLNLFITQNSIISPNDTSFEILNMEGIQRLAPLENEHPERDITPEEISTLNHDVNRIINFAVLQTSLQSIVNEAQFNVITQGLTGDILGMSLNISEGFASANDVHAGEAAFVNWFTAPNAFINEAFVGNFSVNFSLTVRYTATESFSVSRNLTTITTNNIDLENVMLRYVNGGSILGSRTDAAQIFTSSSRGIIESRNNDEAFIADDITNALLTPEANLGDIIMDEFFDPSDMGVSATSNLSISRVEPTENVVNSLTWTNEFFKNQRVQSQNWNIPAGQFTRAGLQNLHSNSGLFQAINLVWGVDMGDYNIPEGEVATAARDQIIIDWMERFNDQQNMSITGYVNNFVENNTGFKSNADALVKIGHGALNNLSLEIDGYQILLPVTQIPLALTISNENRLSAAVNQAYAENIRRALATIQYFYTIDTSLYQQGAISLLGGFHRQTISIGINDWNMWENLPNTVSSAPITGTFTTEAWNLESRFNLQGGIGSNGQPQNPPHWSSQIRPLIQSRINQTNDFRHSFGTHQNTAISLRKQWWGQWEGFNISWIGSAHEIANRNLTYQLDLDYFGFLLGSSIVDSASTGFQLGNRNFVFTRAQQS